MSSTQQLTGERPEAKQFDKWAAQLKQVRLTRRQVEVLSLIAEGYSSKEAAEKLVVSKRTIDFHLAKIYDKLAVHNRTSAIRKAREYGLIPHMHPYEVRFD
jgi:DNA-binding NarL/FixJ family response regulator